MTRGHLLPIFRTKSKFSRFAVGESMNFFYLVFILSVFKINALEHQIQFTNPLCYTPDKPITYCTENDYHYNILKKDGVFQKYVKTLFSEPYHTVVVSYLSYSNPELTKAYQALLWKNQPQFTLILDDPFEKEPYSVRKKLRQVLTYEDFHTGFTSQYLSHKNNKPIRVLSEAYNLLKFAHDNNIHPRPKLLLRGQTHGSGYSHMKITYLESSNNKKLVLGSANLSQGLALHHENWHFFEDSIDSNFVETHKCVLDLLINPNISYYKSQYAKHLSQCTSSQDNSYYTTYFTPGQGSKAIKDIEAKFKNSQEIWIAAHRFSNKRIIKFIKQALAQNKTVKLLVDDDLYWVEHEKGRFLNSKYEVKQIKPLIDLGLKIKYVSTNHKEFLLHHNKYIIFINDNRAHAVFTGAGNLTISAFTKNFENYFMTTKTIVNDVFKNQYDVMWRLGLEAKDLASKH